MEYNYYQTFYNYYWINLYNITLNRGIKEWNKIREIAVTEVACRRNGAFLLHF